MKNYEVKVLFDFNDTEEKTEAGTDTPRRAGDVFNCTKERYEDLKKHNAVMLMGIDEFKENVSRETKEEKPKRKNKKKIDTVE